MKLIVLLTALTAALILPTAVAQSYDDPNVERIVEQMKAEAEWKSKMHKGGGFSMQEPGAKCKFKCGKGMKAVPKEDHYVRKKGCQSGAIPGMPIDDYNRKFDSCCRDHSLCYGTCKKKKTKCDEQLESCMKEYCETKENSEEKCFSRAKQIAATPKMFGCDGYKKAQEEACDCVRKDL